ncbi:MAG: transcriptional regulator, partial [Chloroflexi bacterium]|nr:transcriptional regulator [Chloroflexota bacterium]
AFRAGQHAAALAAWAEAIAFFEQALAGTEESERGPVLLALGEARLRADQPARSSEAFREVLALAESQAGMRGADASGVSATRLALARSLLVQGRYAEAISLAGHVLAAGSPDYALSAELTWGTALSLEGGDLAAAAEHLQRAHALAAAGKDPVALTHVTFELGSVAAQQGDLPRAVTLYREAIAVAESAEPTDDQTWHILAYNNLAYHLHLMGDPAAGAYARTGLQHARETGALPLLTYLHSTLGEIALAASDPGGAEAHFVEGLALAERLSVPERIAGLTANLGRLALARGETTLAVHRLSTALARTDALGTRHLAAQIRLWLAPLLPPAEARACLAEARAFAEIGPRRRLLDEAISLEREIETV